MLKPSLKPHWELRLALGQFQWEFHGHLIWCYIRKRVTGRGGGLGMARCGACHTLIWPRMGAIAHSYCHLMLLCFWSELRGRKKTPCFDFAIPQFDFVLRHCADIRSFASIIHDAICNGPSHLRIGFWYKCCCPIPKQEKPNTIGKPHEAHHSMHGV